MYDPYDDYDDTDLCDFEPDPLYGPQGGSWSGDFTVYPNPASHSVTVRLNPALVEMEREVSILSLEGKEVARHLLPEGSLKKQYDVSGLSPGTYFIVVLEKGKKRFTDKLTVIK